MPENIINDLMNKYDSLKGIVVIKDNKIYKSKIQSEEDEIILSVLIGIIRNCSKKLDDILKDKLRYILIVGENNRTIVYCNNTITVGLCEDIKRKGEIDYKKIIKDIEEYAKRL